MTNPKRMDPSVLLQKHLPSLTQELDSTRLLDHLFSQRIFNRCEYDHCRSLPSTAQSREITLRLMDKGERGYGVLCSWLERHQPHLKSLLDESARAEDAGSLVFVNENDFNEALAAKNSVIAALENVLKEREEIIQTLKTSQVQEQDKLARCYEDKRKKLEKQLAQLSGTLDKESKQLSQSKEDNDKLKCEIQRLSEEKSKLEEDVQEQKELYEAVTNLTDNGEHLVAEEDDSPDEELPCCILGTSACDRKLLLLLPCLHAVCSPCLEQCEEEVITCSCGEEVNVKDVKQVDHVRRNEERNAIATSIYLCGFFCKQTTQAESRCLNCDVAMCKSCLTSHREIRAFESHRIVDFNSEGGSIRGSCTASFEDPTKEGCRNSNLSEMVKIHKEKIDNIQVRILQTKAKLLRVNETERKTLSSMNSAHREVLLMFLRHFKQMAENVQSSTEGNRKTLRENMAKLKQTLSKFGHTIDYAERAVKRTNDAEFRELVSMIQSKLSKNLNIKFSVKFELNEDSVTGLLEDDVSQLQGMIPFIGTGELREKFKQKPEMEEGTNTKRQALCLEPEVIRNAYATISQLGDSFTGSIKLMLTWDQEKALFDTILCPRAEFNREKANSQVVTVLNNGKLHNRPTLRRNSKMLTRYEGTTITTHLLLTGSLTYHEIHATVELAAKLPNGFQILEVALCKDGEQDAGRMLGGRGGSVSFQLVHCMVHKSICRLVRNGKDIVRCSDNTFANIATVLAVLQYGFLVDQAQGRLAFLDITKNDVLAVLDNVGFEDDCQWMCGVYSPEYTRVTVELASGENLQMTQEKLMLIAKAMTMTSSRQ